MKSKSQRITVSGRNLQFLEQLSRDMDETNFSEVLSYLLTDVRLLNYQIGNKVQPQPQPTQTRIGYDFDPNTFEPAFPERDRHDRNHVEVDPIILRMASLIEEF